MKKIGLVLSGGGVRGFAHLGIIQVMEECGIKISGISGVSAGAIVGALYAAGYSPLQVLKAMKSNSYFNISSLRFNGIGFFSMQPLADVLKMMVPHDSFEQLVTPLYVTATDLTRGVPQVFLSGKLSDAVIASASIPVVFEPSTYNNTLYVDGGVVNNLPVEPLKGKTDALVASHVNKLQYFEEPAELLKGKLFLLERCFHLSIANTVYSRSAECDLFIEPDLHKYSMFNTSMAEDIYETGYQEGLKFKQRLQDIAEL